MRERELEMSIFCMNNEPLNVIRPIISNILQRGRDDMMKRIEVRWQYMIMNEGEEKRMEGRKRFE